VSRLRPNDDIVFVPYEFDVHSPPHNMTAHQTLENIVLRSSAVALVDVTTVRAVWMRDGTWIDTLLSGTIQRLLRHASSDRLTVGKRIDAHVSGGEITVGHTLVRVSFKSSPGLVPHQTYLLFLNDDDGVLALTYAPTLRVTPAMEARLTDHVWSIDNVIELLDRRSAVAA
jgi:hypothetical protein